MPSRIEANFGGRLVWHKLPQILTANSIKVRKVKPYCSSLKDGRLDLVYYRDPGLNATDQFRFGLFTDGAWFG